MMESFLTNEAKADIQELLDIGGGGIFYIHTTNNNGILESKEEIVEAINNNKIIMLAMYVAGNQEAGVVNYLPLIKVERKRTSQTEWTPTGDISGNVLVFLGGTGNVNESYDGEIKIAEIILNLNTMQYTRKTASLTWT